MIATHDGASVRAYAESPQECAALMTKFGVPLDSKCEGGDNEWAAPGKRATISLSPCPCGCGKSIWTFRGWNLH
jgi:hypothetical protein